MRVLATRRFPGDFESQLKARLNVSVLEKGRPADREELLRALWDCDILWCTLTDRVDRELIQRAPGLKYVVTYSAGLDHLDKQALHEKGIRVSSTPAVLTDATAELTWALILACSRRFRAAMPFMDEGRFSGFDPGLFLGKALRGSVLGIVGMGRIGSAVAARAQAFGSQVVFHDPTHADQSLGRKVELAELLTQADIVSLHCSLTPQTRHLLGRKELALMKSDAVLVNTSRGSVVEEQALIAHLRTKPDFQAGLDVFEEEPKVPAELLALPNVLCLPHLGSAVRQIRLEMSSICVSEILRFIVGEPLQYEVNLG